MKPAEIFQRRWLLILLASLLIAGFFATRTEAQTAEALSTVKRVALDWPDSAKISAAIRDRVVLKLKGSGTVELVADPAKADAVVHGKATVWVTGRETSSPRSKATAHATYAGFAQMEVSGKDGLVLWSYLATGRIGWKTITDDLADQLTHEFLAALTNTGNTLRGGESPEGAKSGAQIKVFLRGAGSTLGAPMYQKWFEGFRRGRPQFEIQYAAVGSAEGLRRVLAGEADFGASDMPLAEQQLNTPKRRLLQIATMVGAVVPIYNVNDAPDGLSLTSEVLIGIFLGKIQRWDAPEIRAINKHAKLPHAAIEVIHRSDGSGTTYAWTEYLSKVSAEWNAKVGAGLTVVWPVGIGAEGNGGVAATVRRTANSIGYVEFFYALQHELDFAAVQNASGEFVKADLDSVTAAAKTAGGSAKKELDTSITNAVGKHVYPIATLTWLLVPVGAGDELKTASLRDLLRWILTNGQRQCEGLGYAPLPTEFANRELRALNELH
jgi:phosphate ABC transporter phosphate-binding protein